LQLRILMENKTMKNKFRKYYHKNRSSVLIFIFSAVFLAVGLSQITPAQVIRTRPTPPPPQVRPTPPSEGKSTVFKGTGRIQPNPQIEQFKNLSPAAARLSMAEKRNLLSGVMSENGVNEPVSTVKTYAVLDPGTTFIHDKGYISIYNASFVGSYDLWGSGDRKVFTVAAFPGRSNYEALAIHIKPARVGQWLMVDCSVSIAKILPYVGRFKITGPEGSVTEKLVFADIGRLQVFLLAQNTEWQSITIEQPKSFWSFNYCEIIEPN
jgi:hypothetical protein